MVVQHNIESMFSQRQLKIVTDRRAKDAEKLSSGYRINRAADDAAGLAISEKLRYQVRGLHQASDNITAGISLVQLADGALAESHSILQRMNELAVQAANDTNTDTDRWAIQLEMDELAEELTYIAERTSFNQDIYPLKGEGTVEVGGTGDTSETIFPPELIETTFRYVNDTQANIVCNGITYKPGETVEMPGAIWNSATKARQPGTLVSLGDYGGFLFMGIGLRGTTGKVTDILSYYATLDRGKTYELFYIKKDDIYIDEDEYLYIYCPGMTDADFNYYTTSGLTEGVFQTQSVEWKEERHCLKLLHPSSSTDQNQQATARNCILIQSGCLAYQTISVPLVDATAKNLGVEWLDVLTHTHASQAIGKIHSAIDQVSSWRSTFGACQNRLEHAQANVDNQAENSQAAESRLRDMDMADGMVSYSTANIISEAATSMLAQANQSTSQVLSLLQGA